MALDNRLNAFEVNFLFFVEITRIDWQHVRRCGHLYLDFSGSGLVLLLNVPSFFEIKRQKFLFKTKQTIH